MQIAFFVDPAVGSDRRAIAVETGHGQIFVAPDNGLIVAAANECGGIRSAYELTNRSLMLSPMSQTFHGRDVFAPATAHIATLSSTMPSRTRPSRPPPARPAIGQACC